MREQHSRERHQHARRGNPPPVPITGDDLIWVFQQVIERAHAHGIKVVGCTLTPYEGAGYARENGEAIRDTVNRWIRTNSTGFCKVPPGSPRFGPQNPVEPANRTL